VCDSSTDFLKEFINVFLGITLVGIQVSAKLMKKIEEIAKNMEIAPDQVIENALSSYIAENLETTWKEKLSLKKKKGVPWSSKIPETEYDPPK